MPQSAQIRCFVPTLGVLLLAAAVCTAHSQTLPPSAPTQPLPATAQAPPKAQPNPRAHIEYTAGSLSITADNSSLNQILSDVARVTGMKITGGVRDERVFGTYGPASAQAVLTDLLEGTGSNILLFEDAHHRVKQLVLSPRTGGVSPPTVSSTVAEGRERGERDLPPEPGTRHHGFDRTQPNHSPYSQGAPPAAVAGQPSADTTTQQSPNGVKTPQQIYDDLIQKQQQQQTQPTTPSSVQPAPPSPTAPPNS